MKIEAIHHVALGVTDLERSHRFYSEILGLEEIERPPFGFPGLWFSAGGSQQVHLIVHPDSTFRTGKGLDTRDGHFAVRVAICAGGIRCERGELPADGGIPSV